MSVPEQSMAAGVLASLPGMTPTRLRSILDGGTTPLSVLETIDKGEYPATYARRWKGQCGPAELERLQRLCDSSGVGIETLYTDHYPSSLRSDRNAPAVIFYNGNPTILNRTKIICLVGTRAASPYGTKLAYEIGFALSRAGITVVSGLAAGIDAAAHRGAIDAIHKSSCTPSDSRADLSVPYANADLDGFSGFDGNFSSDGISGSGAPSCSGGRVSSDGHGLSVHNNSTGEIMCEDPPADSSGSSSSGSVVAVMAGGPDVSYPAKNQDIFRDVASCGVVTSELPPGASAPGWRVVARNRIMAAMSSLVVVVESHAEGGALHTVHQAEIRGIPVAAVPGAVTSSASDSCNALIKTGRAHLVTGADDIMALLEDAYRESPLPDAAFTVDQSIPAYGDSSSRPVRNVHRLAVPQAPARQAHSGSVRPPRLDSERSVLATPVPAAPAPPISSSTGSGPKAQPYPDSTGSACLGSTRDEIDSRLGRHTKLSGVEGELLHAVLNQLSIYPLTLDEIVMRSGNSVGCISLCLEQLEDIGLAREYAGCWMRC